MYTHIYIYTGAKPPLNTTAKTPPNVAVDTNDEPGGLRLYVDNLYHIFYIIFYINDILLYCSIVYYKLYVVV